MSYKTPRTDAAMRVVDDGPPLVAYKAMVDVSRILERELSTLQSRAVADEKDAARYRWLRTAEGKIYNQWHWSVERYDHKNKGWDALDGDELDAAIDAAIAEERKT
jgi:hypothetical protein